MLPASLELRRDGAIAIVHLDRTAKRNALDA
jgi:enoyl-CoA hydratase/carnithine racemase